VSKGKTTPALGVGKERGKICLQSITGGEGDLRKGGGRKEYREEREMKGGPWVSGMHVVPSQFQAWFSKVGRSKLTKGY